MGTAASTSTALPHPGEASAWQRWLHHPENLWIHRALFQVHLWLGTIGALYILAMSLSGSVIVFRNQLEAGVDYTSRRARIVEWLVSFHSSFLSGELGRRFNGIGAIAFTLICFAGLIIWWPGVAHWRRSLTVNWKASFALKNWDLHNVLGFWCFLFLAMWGLSGIYFCFPELPYPLYDSIDPNGNSRVLHFVNVALLSITDLHFGRFGLLAQSFWSLLGLVPALLALTGLLMYCHRCRRKVATPRE